MQPAAIHAQMKQTEALDDDDIRDHLSVKSLLYVTQI